MKRTLLLFLALFLASCGPEDGPTSTAAETTSWAPRLSYANGANVPKVDRVRLVVTLADGKGTVLEREADWSQGKVVVDGIPVGVSFNAVVKGELSDGSVVWSGASNVGGGSGEVAIASQVTVASPLEIQLSLDESDLMAPGSGKFPRVSVKDWPYADTGIHVLYTTDNSVPRVSNLGASTREYAGPFTLQGSGTLQIRAVKLGESSAMLSSTVLSRTYAGTNPSTCNVPGFQPLPGRFQAQGEIAVTLDGASSCALRYRTDGQDPTATDPLWANGAVWLSNGTTHLKLRAYPSAAGGTQPSPVAEASWSCPACTEPAVSIQADGATEVSVNAGMSLGLAVTVSGASGSDVVWNVDSGMGLGNVTGNGTTAQVYGMAGMSGTMLVRASLPGQGRSVVFRVSVTGTSSGSILSASGATQLGLPAGGTVQLSTIVTGGDPSQVSWMIESGNSLVVFETGAAGPSTTIRALSGSTSGTAVVRASLNGQSVHFTLTLGGSGTASGTIAASGPTTLTMASGGTLELATTVMDAPVSQVSWSIESGSMYVYLPAMSTGSVVQLQAYALTGSGNGQAKVRASLPNGSSVLFDVSVEGQPVDTTFAVSGDSVLFIGAGGYGWLSVNLSGADGADIAWSVDGNSESIALTPGGSSANMSASTILANGKTADTVRVRARLGTSSRELTWRIVITGGQPLTFATSGTSTYSLQAGGSLQLDAMVTGKRNPVVTWTVVSGVGSVTAGSTSTSCTYTAPSSVTEETDVQVKGVLDGTDLVINYHITVSVRPKLEIMDTTWVAKLLYAPERRAPKLFEARRGTGPVTATWEVLEMPAGATYQLYKDGNGFRFKGSLVGDYRLVAREGGDADTVTVRWPLPPSIAFGPDSVQATEPGEYIYMFPKVFPADEALTWSIGGAGTGSVYSSPSMYNPSTSIYSNGAYYTVPGTLVGDSSVVEVTASMTSVSDKSLTYRIVIYPRGWTVRDGSGRTDTVFTVTDTSKALDLSAWRKGKRSNGMNWGIVTQPEENLGAMGSQRDGVLSFKPTVPGTYVLDAYSSLDGMYAPKVRVVWGSALP